MASGVPHSTGTGDYVQAPETYQREMPLSEQLVQVKESAKGKLNEFADQANLKFEQSKNDPSNRASDERLQRDLDTTAADAKSSTNQAINQVSSVFNAMKGAFMSTRNEGTATATPTTTTPTTIPESTAARPAQSVSESLGQTAAAITDAVKNAVTPRRVTAPGTQPGLNNAAANVPQGVVGTQPAAAATTNLPQDVPRRAPY